LGSQAPTRERPNLLQAKSPRTKDTIRTTKLPPHIASTVLIRLTRRHTNKTTLTLLSKQLLHRQSHSHNHSRVLTYYEGSPCETLIQGGAHLNDTEKGGHHIWISSLELQGLNNYQTKDLLLSALAHLWDDNTAQFLGVEKPTTLRQTWHGRSTKP
jgi:hypothetical protein